MYDDWFDDEGANSQHKTFLDVLRNSARSWPECPPNATSVLLYPDPDDEDEEYVEPNPSGYAEYDAALKDAFVREEPVLEAIVYIIDFGGNLRLKVLGATLVGTKLLCMERNDSFWPVPSKDVKTLEATGSSEELGRVAAAWFEEIVRRPVISAPRPPGTWYFAAPDTALPTGHRWARNGPNAE
ncbi:hypothetical protein ACGFY7_39220 [Streptomyces prunicolor]|jgi:hypothetical protein|uniref:hypothetical protein n=1 Tax=Streptomyces prunicolor TaxID=67348 RepID=UPI0037245CD3